MRAHTTTQNRSVDNNNNKNVRARPFYEKINIGLGSLKFVRVF